MSSAWSRQHRLGGPAGAVVSRYVDYRLVGFAPGVHAGLPSRHLTLLVSFDEPIELVDQSGAVVGQHRALIAGLHSSASFVRHNGTQIGVQLGLNPLTVASAIGVPAGQLAGQSFGLDSVMSGADDLVDQLGSVGPDERLRVVERAFTPARTDTLGAELSRAWEVFVRSNGLAKVSDVAEDVGWSRRHLTDRFRRAFGLAPTDARRVLRFERAHGMFLGGHPLGWAGIAADSGYSDQPHLVREWKRITGSSPARWAETEELPFVQDNDGLITENRVHV